MTNKSHLLSNLSADVPLDEKKQQTTKKIRFVTSYVRKWLFVWMPQDWVTTVNFIDCMCNAGIYKDGDLGTPTEALLLFCESAKDNPSKQFNLFVNDTNEKRLKACVEVCEALEKENPAPNVTLYHACMDVNDFLETLESQGTVLNSKKGATLLFVDPYSAGTVSIPILQAFIKRYYCEVFFNWFSSDYTRNSEDERILSCFGGLEIPKGKSAAECVSDALRVGSIKHVFNYPFRNSKNAELYQIMFATPKLRGLEKLKESLWDTFDGKEYHRNAEPQDGQGSLFTVEDDRDMRLSHYAAQAQKILVEAFAGETVPYNVIQSFLLENTMLQEGTLLENVVKPLLRSGKLRKLGLVDNVRNYKSDTYKFD